MRNIWLFLGLLILTGCTEDFLKVDSNEETLTCEYGYEIGETTIKSSMKFTYVDLKLSEISMLTKNYSSDINEAVFNSSCEEYEGVTGIDCTTNIVENEGTLTVYYDYELIDKNYDDGFSQYSSDDLKQEFELMGFTCN